MSNRKPFTAADTLNGGHPPPAPAAIAELLEYAHGYNDLAAFLAANPDIADRAVFSSLGDRVHIPLSVDPEPGERLAEYARRAAEAGAEVKGYVNGRHAGVHAAFGPVRMDVFAGRELVCRQVVAQVDEVRYELAVSVGVVA